MQGPPKAAACPAPDVLSQVGAPSLRRRIRRPNLNHPRCTQRGRPFDTASIVAVVSRSERPLQAGATSPCSVAQAGSVAQAARSLGH